MKALFQTDESWTGLILRLTLGLVIFPHGAQKLLGWYGGFGFSGTMGFFTETMHLPWLIAFLVIIGESFGSVALLLGAIVCLALARQKIQEMVHTATRRSGTILLDLCGAGAFGYVVAQSGLGQEIYSLGQALPILVLPFLVSSVLQLAQGSRVVTAVVAAQVLAGYPMDGITLALLISAGAFMFSYVSDPYFWLIKESTGASMSEMVRGYTVPLSLMGLLAMLQAYVFPWMVRVGPR